MIARNRAGLGDVALPNPIACSGGMVLAPDGSACVYDDDIGSLYDSLTSSMAPTGADASASINASGILATLQPTSGQTFGQWVSANSTFLIVAFSAVGALVALTRIGK
jgi:hypothetical protein